MTTQTEALKLALEALIVARASTKVIAPVEIWCVNDKAITAIKEALSQPEQEPVAWLWELTGEVTTDSDRADGMWLPLYTTPPQRTQVDLTDEEVLGLFGKFTSMTGKSWLDLYRMTEAKRKEKNT